MPIPVIAPVGISTRSRTWRPSINHGVVHHKAIAATTAMTAYAPSSQPPPVTARATPMITKYTKRPMSHVAPSA